jgi:hypothetical protein
MDREREREEWIDLYSYVRDVNFCAGSYTYRLILVSYCSRKEHAVA